MIQFQLKTINKSVELPSTPHDWGLLEDPYVHTSARSITCALQRAIRMLEISRHRGNIITNEALERLFDREVKPFVKRWAPRTILTTESKARGAIVQALHVIALEHHRRQVDNV